MEKSKIVLFDKKTECCACGACLNICPKKAISMKEDRNGFSYPHVDKMLCVGCGACKRVCSFQNRMEEKGARKVYAASRKEKDKIVKSTSGGIFAVLAEKVIEDGGVVYGAAMIYENKKLFVKHIAVDNKNDLIRVQGSKYVQSSIGSIYQEVKANLLTGKLILFSGTPCQVAGLNGYLGKKYDNLITVDIICHGVPNIHFFQDYLTYKEEIVKGKINDFIFRNKENGWGLKAKVTYTSKEGKKVEENFSPKESSYYSLFLDGEIYRENCYQCKYTNANRPADITIGDFWGIQRVHPEYLTENGGNLELKCGISAIIVNTQQGERQLEKVIDKLNYYPAEFEEVAVGNPQLQRPCAYPKNREKIFKLYQSRGYAGVHQYFVKKEKIKRVIATTKKVVKIIVPEKLIQIIKK